MNVQSDLVDVRTTRVVIPLIPRDVAPQRLAKSLNPLFQIQGGSYVLLTQAIASIQVAHLAEPIGTLASQRDAIIRAVDALLSGL